jgi:hypothetical protein
MLMEETLVDQEKHHPFEDSYGYARAIRVGDHVFVSGTTARPPALEGDAYMQMSGRNRDGRRGAWRGRSRAAPCRENGSLRSRYGRRPTTLPARIALAAKHGLIGDVRGTVCSSTSTWCATARLQDGGLGGNRSRGQRHAPAPGANQRDGA